MGLLFRFSSSSMFVKRPTTVVEIAARRVDGRTGHGAASRLLLDLEFILSLFFLHQRDCLFLGTGRPVRIPIGRTIGRTQHLCTRMFSRLVARPQLIEPRRARPQMRALVQAALVAHDLARVERRAPPGRGFGGVTVVTPATEVLRLLGRGVVGVLDGDGGVRGHVERHGRELAGLGGRARVEDVLGGDHDGLLACAGVFELDAWLVGVDAHLAEAGVWGDEVGFFEARGRAEVHCVVWVLVRVLLVVLLVVLEMVCMGMLVRVGERVGELVGVGEGMGVSVQSGGLCGEGRGLGRAGVGAHGERLCVEGV